METTDSFSIKFYTRSLSRILKEPRIFFSELPQKTGAKQALWVLVVSGLLHTVAGIVSSMPSDPLLMGGIFLTNAIGMVLITAAFAYMVMIMIMGRYVTFARIFTVYSLCSGVTLLVSWMPYFAWLTEPWRWYLVVVGLVMGCKMKWSQSLVIVILSQIVIVLLFWSATQMLHLR